MKYKSVVLTKKGGPEVLQITENELCPPNNGEVQIKVLACGVGRTDIAMRYGYYPFAPKKPFVPGYQIVGIIEAIGTKVKQFKIGDRVASLTVYGGYSEYIYLEPQHLVKVPENVKSEEATLLILNYVTAYQMLKRVANVQKGDKILITGASGGVGTALLDLAKLEDLNVYALASKHKHETIEKMGAFPMDYNSTNWMKLIKTKELKGLDFVFDGIAKSYIDKGFSLLKKGGKLVEFGYPSFLGMLSSLFKIILLNSFPNGRNAEFYGISGAYKKDKSTILYDLEALLTLLKDKKIKPIISTRMPILEASEANKLLESGLVSGNIVLLASELL
ncbi:medium chain dehydrogenase/reductase family protein [Olleya sp. Bg11-27]|uniref:medium chain dehydrogenase/reductase family protein n=1 Tax=Olleya sp. Bg11-27 TaxID=2058135 RepID=UPI000C303479|nr:medium chain dehydrogenase/reductase family protein [Olleya sp. Bg11-27]AUC75887.1 oxidoreductase [Olleya sp. Bg11-27]